MPPKGTVRCRSRYGFDAHALALPCISWRQHQRQPCTWPQPVALAGGPNSVTLNATPLPPATHRHGSGHTLRQ